MTERAKNTANQYIGGAKQTVGEAMGKPDLAASGAAQKSNAEAARKAAEARIHAHGVGHSIEGQVQQTLGAMTNDPAMQSRGIGSEARANIERNLLSNKTPKMIAAYGQSSPCEEVVINQGSAGIID
ncbi:hypothetical protein BGZ51_007296 [Haplosporangium sp. Z 767]|nr:hypothetical protein BGZ51_007296 [Haplosporangium sp. Z 767]